MSAYTEKLNNLIILQMMRKVWLWLILSSFLTAAADVPSEESDVLEANEEAKNLTDILNVSLIIY